MRLSIVLALSLALVSQAAFAVTVTAGQEVVVKAKEVGVPFHSEARSSLKGRIPSATQVSVLQVHPKSWLEIRKHDGEKGFIKKKYVLGVVGDTASFQPGSVTNPTSLDGLPSTPSSFSGAKKKMYKQVYKDHEITFYCGCEYANKKPDLQSCDYDSSQRSQASRAKRTEAEHIVPASWFGQGRACWRGAK